jgi:hypothetical protein
VIRRIAVSSAVVVALAFAVVSFCSEPPPASPFEGARPLRIESIERGVAPTAIEIERVVDALIEAAGGADRLAQLSWRRVEDLYLSHTGVLVGNRVVNTVSLRPDRSVRTLLEYESGEFEQRVMLRGEPYIQPRLSPLRVATGFPAEHVGWDWEVARLPWLLRDASLLKPLPPRTDEGRVLLGFQVEIADTRPAFEAWIDLSGPMIVEVRARLPVSGPLVQGSTAEQWQLFSDFRRVDGVLFPFRRDLWIEGARFGLGETREIEVGAQLEDADFLPDGPPR